MDSTAAMFRLLADPTRLRLLRVLARDRFNGSELTAILGLAQSGVSRHISLLKEHGLVVEEREGAFIYYHLSDAGPNDPHAALRPLLESEFAAHSAHRLVRQDDTRLQEVLRVRKESFDPHADARQLVPGRSWPAWARALGHLLPAVDVADIGCGDGYLTVEAAAWANRVIGIDRSDDVLERAKGLAERRRVTNIEWKKGDLARLPLRDGSVDIALLSQSLHHASDPERATAEAARILRPGGRLLVLELKSHGETWVKAKFGDRHLGFSPFVLEGLVRSAGLSDVRITTGARRAGDPFTVLIASGVKPATDSAGL
jgi:SAM-dependent methyltransferase/biotin operon repressor